MKKKTDNRGGARPGSGAKKKLIGPNVRRVYLDEGTASFLRTFGTKDGKANLSEGVRRAGAISKSLRLAVNSGDPHVIAAAFAEAESTIRSFS
jgi:hypothetical protein